MIRKSVNSRIDKKVYLKTANRSKQLPGRVVRNKRGGRVF